MLTLEQSTHSRIDAKCTHEVGTRRSSGSRPSRGVDMWRRSRTTAPGLAGTTQDCSAGYKPIASSAVCSSAGHIATCSAACQRCSAPPHWLDRLYPMTPPWIMHCRLFLCSCTVLIPACMAAASSALLSSWYTLPEFQLAQKPCEATLPERQYCGDCKGMSAWLQGSQEQG